MADTLHKNIFDGYRVLTIPKLNNKPTIRKKFNETNKTVDHIDIFTFSLQGTK